MEFDCISSWPLAMFLLWAFLSRKNNSMSALKGECKKSHILLLDSL